MTQLVQLQQRIVKRILKVKVCGISALALIVRRVLNRRKILHLVLVRHNHHAARVLAGGTLNTGTAILQSLNLRLGGGAVQTPLLQVLDHIAKAVFSATVAMVPALNTWDLPNSSSVNRWLWDW